MRFSKKSKHNFFDHDSGFMPGSFVTNVDEHEGDGDGASIVSYSTMATTSSNRGAGWAVDKYFYQRAGRWIEERASRIGLRFCAIPSFIIARRVQDLLYTDVSLWLPVEYASSLMLRRARVRGEELTKSTYRAQVQVTIDKGIDCLVKQLQYVAIVSHLL